MIDFPFIVTGFQCKQITTQIIEKQIFIGINCDSGVQ